MKRGTKKRRERRGEFRKKKRKRIQSFINHSQLPKSFFMPLRRRGEWGGVRCHQIFSITHGCLVCLERNGPDHLLVNFLQSCELQIRSFVSIFLFCIFFFFIQWNFLFCMSYIMIMPIATTAPAIMTLTIWWPEAAAPFVVWSGGEEVKELVVGTILDVDTRVEFNRPTEELLVTTLLLLLLPVPVPLLLNVAFGVRVV